VSRALTLSADARREIDAAIRDTVAGKPQAVVDRLCAIRGHFATPDVKKPRQDALATLRLQVQRLERELAQASQLRAPVAVQGRPVRPQPKPHRRHKEPDRVAEFRALFPACSVLGCANGDADPHHIWERGEGGGAGGGSDDHANLLALCRLHHDEWHRPAMGREGFLAKYGARRLPPVAILKIKLAAEMIVESKLMGRPAIDLDAEVV
jgi:hypothetical protein